MKFGNSMTSSMIEGFFLGAIFIAVATIAWRERNPNMPFALAGFAALAGLAEWASHVPRPHTESWIAALLLAGTGAAVKFVRK